LTGYIAQRLAQSLLVVLVMSLAVFAGVYAIGDPVAIMIPPDASQADAARLKASLGLDQPLWQQYLGFLGQVASGDFGVSFAFNAPALRLVLERLPATMELAVAATLLAVLLGIPLGLLAGLRPHGITGKTIMAGSILGFSMPTFWVGLLLIMLFAVQWGWLPASGRGPTTEVLGISVSILSAEGLRHLLLPALNLALFKLALVIRLTRAGTREALNQDYVRFARAKGLQESRVVGVHLLRNILIPVVTVAGLEFGSLVAFSIVTETIFAWPGMGKLLIDSINVLDRPVVVAYLCITVMIFVLINLVVDVLYAVLDPRVRLEAGAS
jgi:peptide/nickel transport system permease protein